jgi:nucleotide-binding universal stress UspA family protein
MHFLSPVYWEYGGGDLATAGLLEQAAWLQERQEEKLTEAYFAQAREILANAGVSATHIHTKEEWNAADVANAILQELQQGAFTAVVIGQHHHTLLSDLFGGDLASVLNEHAPGIVVWTIETYPSSNRIADLERSVSHV